MSRTSVKKSQQQFQSVLRQLEGKLLQLRSRRETMDTHAFVVVNESMSVSRNRDTGVSASPEALDERTELYHGGEVGRGREGERGSEG